MPPGPRRPDVFIIGAPKTGTTSLYEYLREHPDVYMSPVKEPGYFAPDVPGTRRRGHPFAYPTDEERYLALFADARDEKHLGEASTSYLMSEGAPARIRDFQPDARIIAMVRNPVDLAYSLHNERISQGAEWITDFEEAMAADEDRHRGERLPDGLHGLGAAYRDNALMGAQLERWLGAFPRTSVHVIVYDDFARDPAAELAHVLAFLDIDTTFRPTSFQVHNVSHRRRGGAMGLLLRNPLSRALSRSILPAFIGEARTARLARSLGARRILSQRQDRQPLDAAVRRRLEQEFAPDVRTLSGLLRRDLESEWFGVRSS